VLDYLEQIQRQYGLFAAEQRNFTFTGAEGSSVIRSVMEGFRQNPPTRIGEWSVAVIKDYQSREARSGGWTWGIDLPSADVLAYELEGGARVMLRPSGTEPKIKYYFEVQESLRPDEQMSSARERARERLALLEAAFIELAHVRGQP
jgi:phosphomannomutase